MRPRRLAFGVRSRAPRRRAFAWHLRRQARLRSYRRALLYLVIFFGVLAGLANLIAPVVSGGHTHLH
jgi:hypothetical protein